MKKYLLFCGAVYYPVGGWDDFEGVYSSIERAKEAAKEKWCCEWWHIVDADSFEIVERSEKQ